MRHLLTAMLGLSMVLFLPSMVLPNAEDEFNGYWWASLRPMEKLYFIQGYVYGLGRAHLIVGQAAALDNRSLSSPMSNEPVLPMLNFSLVAYGQFSDGLDQFYSDYKNKRICFNFAILYVRDEIRGESREKLEKRLGGMRQAVVDPNYDYAKSCR